MLQMKFVVVIKCFLSQLFQAYHGYGQYTKSKGARKLRKFKLVIR